MLCVLCVTAALAREVERTSPVRPLRYVQERVVSSRPAQQTRRRLQEEEMADVEARHSGERGALRRKRRGKGKGRGLGLGKGKGKAKIWGKHGADQLPEALAVVSQNRTAEHEPPGSTIAGANASQFETELRELHELPYRSGAWVGGRVAWVDCGARLARSCAACGAGSFGQGRRDCRGECRWDAADLSSAGQHLEGSCVPIHGPIPPMDSTAPAAPHTPQGDAESRLTFAGQRHEFSVASHALWVVSPSSVAAVALSVALMGSTAAVDAGGCSPNGQARFCGGGQPIATAAAAVRRAVRTSPSCTCAFPRGVTWLISPLTVGVAAAAAKGISEQRAARPLLRVALLREPRTMLLHEQLPLPATCLQLPRRDGGCTDDALRAPGGADQGAVPAAGKARGERLQLLRRCCANMQARVLVLSLPREVPGRDLCAGGGCDEGRLLTLASRALLSLAFFGIAELPAASGALLREQLPSLGSSASLLAAALGPLSASAASAAPSGRSLSIAEWRMWRDANAVDFELYDAARGLFEYRLREARLPLSLLRPSASNASASAPAASSTAVAATSAAVDDAAAAEPEPEYDVHEQLRLSRVFATAKGDGVRAQLTAWPRRFRGLHESFVFMHIAKCGGTSFNKRLTMLEVAPSPTCRCGLKKGRTLYHNGHALVEPRSCACPRYGKHGSRAEKREKERAWAPITARIPGAKRDWAFLQHQWLLSPDTTGWLGGVHSPVRVLQQYVMLAAKLTSRRSLAAGLQYVTLVRDPIKRFLSEFYETYNGWEHKFQTWPRVSTPCSSRLPAEQRRWALDGIDHTPKDKYDTLFDDWIHCPNNMAADRQARALSFTVDVNASRRMHSRICAPSLPKGDPEGLCDGRIARVTLLQFSFFGLLEERCLTEKLFEAQFGLRFNRTKGARISKHAGKGAHLVTKLSFSSLTLAQQQRVRWLNRNDLLLYAEAVRIFYERLRLYGISPNATCS